MTQMIYDARRLAHLESKIAEQELSRAETAERRLRPKPRAKRRPARHWKAIRRLDTGETYASVRLAADATGLRAGSIRMSLACGSGVVGGIPFVVAAA